MTTFISVGNAHQSFERFLNSVLDNIDILPRPVIVQYGHTLFNDTRCVSSSFFSIEQYNRCIQDAKLLILHAGAGSVIKALRAGKRPIVVPRRKKYGEIINDHQLYFATEMDKMKKIELVLKISDLRKAIQNARNYIPDGNDTTRNDIAIKIIKDTLLNYETLFIHKKR